MNNKHMPAIPKTPGETCVEGRLDELIAQGKRFGTIYADPPWPYQNTATRGAAEHHYRTMALDEILALPVAELALKRSHLHLWCTKDFLFEAKAVLDAWGFAFKGILVWKKTKLGLGSYWRNVCEFLLLGVRGTLTFRDGSHENFVDAPAGQHSKKPFAVRAKIEAVSPGPYLELFGRVMVEGWTVWGDEVERILLFEAANAEPITVEVAAEPRGLFDHEGGQESVAVAT